MSARMMLGLGLGLVTGCSGPLVGGECLDGWEQRNGACVAVHDDASDAIASASGSSGDAITSQASAGGSDGAGGDGTTAVQGTGGPGDGSGGAVATTGSGGASWSQATGTGGEAGHDGDGGAGGQGGDGGAGGDGGPPCEHDLLLCGDACVDAETDPLHCGSCAIVCPSGLCEEGLCRGEYAGHVVVAGLTEASLSSATPSRIIGNAIYMWPIDPVRILVLRLDGDVKGTLAASVDSEAALRGREATLDETSDVATFRARLEEGAIDVGVLGTLPANTDGASLGTSVAPGFDALTGRGGVVLVLGSGDATATADLLGATSILEGATAETASGSLSLVAGDDALAIGVPTPFARPTGTRGFAWTAFDGRTVIVDEHQRGVVLHGVVDPGL